MVPVFKNAGERSTAKNYYTVSLPSVACKVFGKLVEMGFLTALRNGFDLLDQLQIF